MHAAASRHEQTRLIYHEWQDAKPIGHQMPIDIGDDTLNKVDGICPTCRKVIAQADMRGTVRRTPHETVEIEALGTCWNCKHIVPFFLVVRGNPMRMESRQDNGSWRQCKSVHDQPGLLTRAVTWVLRALTFNLGEKP